MMGEYLWPFRSGLLASAALVAIAAPSQAVAQVRNFNVPAQSASRGIPAFARQAGVQILASGNVVRGRRTNAVRGSLTVEEGLRQLLAGTGLEASGTGGTGIITVRASVGTETPGSGEAEAGGVAADDESADAGATPEILVVGQRTQNVDVRRSEDDAQPYVVITREDIEASQASNVGDFLRQRLPMNTVALTNERRGNDPAGSNISQVNLRGLGVAQTLILVDGRRAPRVLTEGSTGAFSQADMNGIPLSAIERIEILPATAGGIYGGGAVGGVINIIRRRDYRGIEARLFVGGSLHGGGEEYGVQVNGGASLFDGATRIGFSGSYQRTEPLYVGDNDLWRAGRELYVRNDPSASPFPGATPNIRSVTGETLVFDSGTSLNSNRTSVPTGYAGTSSDGGLALVQNAGRYNLELSDDVNGRRATLRNNPRILSVNANVRQEIGRDVELFSDLTYSENRGRNFFAFNVGNVPIPAAASNNPFRQDIIVIFPVPSLARPNEVESSTLDFTAGGIWRIGRGWAATAEYGWARSRVTASFTQNVLSSAASTAFRNGTLDVVRDLRQFPLDLQPFTLASPDTFNGPNDNIQERGSLRVAGPLVSLPGGALTITGLAERRTETADQAGFRNPSGTTIFPLRSQSVESAYLELLAPIIAPANGVALLRELELQASVRHDRYRTRAPSPVQAFLPTPTTALPTFTYSEAETRSTDFTLGVIWSPARGIRFRGSYSTGFLPPAINQIVSIPLAGSTFLNLRDPLRGNQVVGTAATFTRVLGGNPNLLPEQSRSWSAGVILTPDFLPGFRFSADYLQIRKRDEIGALSTNPTTNLQLILNDETLYPGRVTRGANLTGDLPGWAGPVTQINGTLLNIARTKVETVDFQVDYDVQTRWGHLRLYAIATLTTAFERQLTLASLPFDAAGFSDGPLEWRGNAGAELTTGAWTFSWNAQYYDSYSVRNGSDPGSAANNSAVVLQGAEFIPSQLYHDLNVRYRFRIGNGLPFSALEIAAGIQNVFDKEPPAIAAPLNGYSPYGDPRLRRFNLSIRAGF